MKTKMLLAAASTLAIAACGGADTETAEVEDYDRDDAELAVAEVDADEDGALETLLSDEQPPLQGDNPFADAEAEIDEEFAEADAELDEMGADLDAEADEFEAGAERFAANTEAELDEAGDEIEAEASDFAADTRTSLAAAGDEIEAEADEFEADAERFAANTEAELDEAGDRLEAGASNLAAETRTAAASLAPSVTDGVSAKQFTAQETDAYIAEDGELITGSEAALLAGSWDVTLGEDGETLPLMISGEGDEATGTFDGEPITVAVTGRNFTFDAPVDMDGESSIMTFTGTFEDGEIDNGVVEAIGDGTTMTFSAERTGDADAAMPMTDAATPSFDTDTDADADMNMDAEADMDMDMEADTDADAGMDLDTDADMGAAPSTDFYEAGEADTDTSDMSGESSVYGDDRPVTDAVRSDVDALEADDVEEADAEALPYDEKDPASGISSMNSRDTGTVPSTNYDAAPAPAVAPLNTAPAAATTDSSDLGDSDADADALTRRMNEGAVTTETETDTDMSDGPSGVMRGIGNSEIEEPLDARGDTFTDGDVGYTDEATEGDEAETEVYGPEQAEDAETTNEFGEITATDELDEMNSEVDGRDDAIEPLDTDDDALDEAMDDDPNFDPTF